MIEARLILAGVIAICILVLGYLLVDHFVWAPIRAKTEAATAHGTAVVNKAHTDAANEAIPIIIEHGSNEDRVNQATRDHYVTITKAAGADDPVNPALWSAYVSSLCVRSSASGVSGCGSVQQPNP